LVPKEGRAFFASNHTGLLEPFWIHVCIPRTHISIVSKKELFQKQPLTWFMTQVGAFWIDRANPGRRLFQLCKATFDSGCDLLMFPQGTRCKVFSRESFKPGLGHLASSNEVMVVPVYYEGFRDPITGRFRRLSVRFGAPIMPFGSDGKLKSKQQIEDEVYRAILQMELETEMRRR